MRLDPDGEHEPHLAYFDMTLDMLKMLVQLPDDAEVVKVQHLQDDIGLFRIYFQHPAVPESEERGVVPNITPWYHKVSECEYEALWAGLGNIVVRYKRGPR